MRARLLAAAAELIPERGWSAVSTRALAERAGVSSSVVHYHYPSIQAVLREAALGLIARLVGELDTVLAGAATAAGAIGELLAAIRAYSGTDPVSLLAIETYLAASRDEQLRAGIAEALAEFRARLGHWLGEHAIPAPEPTAAVLAAALDGLVLHRGLDTDLDSATIDEVLARLVPQDG